MRTVTSSKPRTITTPRMPAELLEEQTSDPFCRLVAASVGMPGPVIRLTEMGYQLAPPCLMVQ